MINNFSSYQFSDKTFSFDNVYIMGIVNVTPNSFSDGGKYFSTEEAVRHSIDLLENGADIIDIGGESTKPGAEEVFVEEELKRVIPVLEQILEIRKDAIISIDTTKSEVADIALRKGASIINDISAGLYDEKMFDVVKKHDAGIILMHMQGKPKTMQINPVYSDLINNIYSFLQARIAAAEDLGIKKIMIDPGIGFGKTVRDNFSLINNLECFQSLHYPLMIGLSRKSFIGKSLNLEIVDREHPTLVLESMCMAKGARIIRTHNVKNAVLSRSIHQLTIAS